jgi:hypothetical protein
LWLYLAVTAVGGQIHYDPCPTTYYRIHRGNVIGSNTSLSSRLFRLRMLLAGRFRSWSDLNIASLECVRPQMLPENRAIFDAFCESRNRRTPIGRMTGIMKSGVYRQTTTGNLGLAFAALTKKI